MLKFSQMQPEQRLFVVDPDFRIFISSRFPAFQYPFARNELLVREVYLDGWLADQVFEYMRESSLISSERSTYSFAIDTLVMFHVGRLNAWRGANLLSVEAEGYLISSKEYDEYVSLLRPWEEIHEWAMDVCGRKTVC